MQSPRLDAILPLSPSFACRVCNVICNVFLALLLAGVASAQESHRALRIPFHTVKGMILLDATVNGKPASLLLDTGADFTLISPQASGLSTVKLRTLTATQTEGANGEYVKSRVDLRLTERHWIEREIFVMDLSDASKRLGTRILWLPGSVSTMCSLKL